MNWDDIGPEVSNPDAIKVTQPEPEKAQKKQGRQFPPKRFTVPMSLSFEQEQADHLKQLSLKLTIETGERVSMAQVVRIALDEYISKNS